MELSEQRRTDLLRKIAGARGFDTVDDFLTSPGLLDAVSPAICTDCHLVCKMEPDQTEGYCEGCGQNTVVADLVLAGLI